MESLSGRSRGEPTPLLLSFYQPIRIRHSSGISAWQQSYYWIGHEWFEEQQKKYTTVNTPTQRLLYQQKTFLIHVLNQK
jgi:hypothetical protein